MARQIFLLPVTDTIIESWKRVDGVKQTFWIGFAALLALALAHVIQIDLFQDYRIVSVMIGAVLTILMMLLSAGLIHLGINRAKDRPVDLNTMLYAFNLKVALHLIGLFILQTLLIMIPTACIALGFYMMTLSLVYSVLGLFLVMGATVGFFVLIVRMIFSPAFILDHDEKPFAAIKKSIHVTAGNFWYILAFLYMSLVIIVASELSFMIGLIWTIPLWYIWYGMSYTALANNNQ